MRVACLVLVITALGGCGDDNPLVTYERSFSGVVRGHATVTVQDDGSAACGDARYDLQDDQLARLRERLEGAKGVQPRERRSPGSERPSIHVVTADYELNYVGANAVPASAVPLVTELDRLISNHCAPELP